MKFTLYLIAAMLALNVFVSDVQANDFGRTRFAGSACGMGGCNVPQLQQFAAPQYAPQFQQFAAPMGGCGVQQQAFAAPMYQQQTFQQQTFAAPLYQPQAFAALLYQQQFAAPIYQRQLLAAPVYGYGVGGFGGVKVNVNRGGFFRSRGVGVAVGGPFVVGGGVNVNVNRGLFGRTRVNVRAGF